MKKIIHQFLDKIRNRIGSPEKQLTIIGYQLSDLSLSIESLMSDAEPEFLKIGQKLEIIYSETEELSQVVMNAVEFADTRTGDIQLANVDGFARESVEKLKSLQNGISENLKILYSGRTNLEKLSRLCTQTDKIHLLLSVIALNIAIESNSTEKSNEMFAAFVEEVKQLSTKMGAISQALYDDTESTRLKQIKSQESLSKHLNHFSKLSDSAEKIVDEATAEIRQLIDASISSFTKAGTCSSDIASQVSQIVMALQFHDIVRQQIEHVITALNDAEKLCTQPPQDTCHDVSHKDTASRAYPILKLQNAQIKGVVSEIDDAYRKILNAFESIEIKGSELVSCMTGSFINIEETNKDINPFNVIATSLENLNNLMSQAYNLDSQVEEAFSDASRSTSGLSNHIECVQKLSLELHRKALNAIIKSAHLGDMGRTLEVLAKEVARTSDDTNNFTEGVTEIITKINNSRNRLKEEPSTIQEPNPLITSTSEITFHQSTQAISNSYQMFLENSSKASELSQKLDSSIANAKSVTSFMPAFSNKMTLLMKQSEGMLQQLNRWRKDDCKETATGVIEASQRYTMESERVIHASLIEEPSATDSWEIASENSGCDINPGIDLFDEEEFVTEESLNIESNNKKQCSTDSNKSETNESPDKDNEFDDNIELF